MISQKIPFYLKATVIIIGLYFFIEILYLSQLILLPLIFALIIAIVLSPLVALLERIKIPRVIAIAISIVLLIALLFGLVFFLSVQMSKFSESFPALLDKSQEAMSSFTKWISSSFNMEMSKVEAYMDQTKSEIIQGSKSYFGKTISGISHLLVTVFLLPVYIFLILYYKPLLLEFIHRLIGKLNASEVDEVLSSTKSIVKQFLVGLVIEIVLVAVLNSLSLMLVGIEYAILFGVIGALLNLIPYIGGIISISLPMLIALANHSVTTALLVLLAYSIVQLIDNNYIMPKLVGSRVKINALVSIIVVIAAGALWGIPGMFLSIPLTAITKVIFDHIESLKPWGFLLGDTMPPMTKFRFPFAQKK